MAEDEITIYIEDIDEDEPSLEIVRPYEDTTHSIGERIQLEVEIENIDFSNQSIVWFLLTPDHTHTVIRTAVKDTAHAITPTKDDIPDGYGDGNYILQAELFKDDELPDDLSTESIEGDSLAFDEITL